VTAAQPGPPPAAPWRRRLAAAADAAPVAVLAAIAGAGSFTHIRDTAAEHGQRGPMAWAVAVCIDLTCVMAARERQRDKRLRAAARRLSWPAAVLAGGAGLSLAANLAQAQPDAWGRITAAVPCGAFLVAVSMIERRAARPAPGPGDPGPPSPPPGVPDGAVPEAAAAVPGAHRGGADDGAVPSPPGPGPSLQRDVPDEAVLAAARRVAAEHPERHGRPVSRDALRARLGVSNQAASALLRQLRTETGPAAGTPPPAAGHDGAAPARAPPAADPRRAPRGPPPARRTGIRPGRNGRVRQGPGPAAGAGKRPRPRRPAAPERPRAGPACRRRLFRPPGRSGVLSLFLPTPEPPETGNPQGAAAGGHSGGLPDCFTGKPVKQLTVPGRPRVQVSP
jgi:hypothetical protein